MLKILILFFITYAVLQNSIILKETFNYNLLSLFDVLPKLKYTIKNESWYNF